MSAVIRELEPSDLELIYRFVDEHDEDDGEEIRHDLTVENIENMFVILVDGIVRGVSGYRPVYGTFGTGYLSWTYVEKSVCNKGYGSKLVTSVMQAAVSSGAEKMFVKVSNYADTYPAASAFYRKLGFREELRNLDFYALGEDQIIMSKTLGESNNRESEVTVKDERPTIRFNGIYEIGDSDGAYSFSWDTYRKTLFGNRSFSVSDLLVGIDAVRTAGGRIIFLTFPSNLPLIHKPLQQAGFKFVGELRDYFEPGVHEMHFVYKNEE